MLDRKRSSFLTLQKHKTGISHFSLWCSIYRGNERVNLIETELSIVMFAKQMWHWNWNRSITTKYTCDHIVWGKRVRIFFFSKLITSFVYAPCLELLAEIILCAVQNYRMEIMCLRVSYISIKKLIWIRTKNKTNLESLPSGNKRHKTRKSQTLKSSTFLKNFNNRHFSRYFSLLENWTLFRRYFNMLLLCKFLQLITLVTLCSSTDYYMLSLNQCHINR